MSVVISPIAHSLQTYLADKNYSSIMVLVDEHTREACYPLIKNYLPPHQVIEILSGEENKHLGTCEYIWGEMTDAQLDRHALLINLGGGVIGDMGGFCASTYKRGIDFIQIPTTLLAQVDASVGGKLGIDFRGFKNHLGVFTLPKSVLIDPAFLQTLPNRELRSGFAEIIKHCLIRDVEMYEIISKKPLEDQNLTELIAHSVEIKKQVVAEDPTEKGVRKILNFGHTLGHAIETYYLDKGNQRLLHGEAIAIGMITEAYLSYKKNYISKETLIGIKTYLISVYGQITIAPQSYETILIYTLQDKKNRGAEVRFSLIDKIGNCRYNCLVQKEEMIEAIDFYNK